jgi:hypothetical protein
MPAKSAPAKTKPAASAAPAKTVKIARSAPAVSAAPANQAVVSRGSRATASSVSTTGAPVMPMAERGRLVAEAAYFLAEQRGFSHGNDLSDWFEAERIVDARYRFS